MNIKFWHRHWKWVTISVIGIIILFFMSPIGNSVTDIARLYADTTIYENALEKVKANDEAIAILGAISPIDKFAIVEGSVVYSNNNDNVIITVRIKGTKNKGKLDIIANKLNGDWSYELIKIRFKDPKETIVVLD